MLLDNFHPNHFHCVMLIGLALLLIHPEEALAKRAKNHARTVTVHQTSKTQFKARAQPSSRHIEPGETKAPSEPTPPLATLESDERLAALKGWLKQRNAERDQSAPPDGEYDSSLLFEDSGSNKSDYGRYRRPDYSYQSPSTDTTLENRESVLRIGRDAEGRVYHRYVLKDSGTEVTTLPGSNREIDEILTRSRHSHRSLHTTQFDEAADTLSSRSRKTRYKSSAARPSVTNKSAVKKTGTVRQKGKHRR